MVEIALYQPDIPQNTGTIIRYCACLGLRLNLIHPLGFQLDDKALKRAGMDYVEKSQITEHISFGAFYNDCQKSQKRLILMTTKASCKYSDFAFDQSDMLVFGRESSGAPNHVHDSADKRLFIPMRENTRSLNLAMSVAMISGEALRQTNLFPPIT